MTPKTRTLTRRTVTCLVVLLLLVATFYATAARQWGDGAATKPAPEVAPLAPPLTHQTHRNEGTPGPVAIAERNARLQVEVFGGGTDPVGGVAQVCAAGGSDFQSQAQHGRRCFEKIRNLLQRMKENRLDRRAARIHRRATTRFLERIGQRRRRH